MNFNFQVPGFVSNLAKQVIAHPYHAAGGAVALGGLCGAAYAGQEKIKEAFAVVRERIARFAIGFFAGVILSTGWMIKDLARTPIFVRVDVAWTSVGLGILACGIIGGTATAFGYKP